MTLIEMILKNRKDIQFSKDILSGVIVALVSIPISMGYAQIAGLPAVYGLYGSVLPILVFGLLSTSRQFVVGVDAMPAVMVGAMLVEAGIAAETKEAISFVPTVSFLVAFWFILFAIFKLGRVVKYISTPVMGGFISGVGLTIIFMQVPKLFGGTPGVGTIIPLIQNILREGEVGFHLLSCVLGILTTIIILLCKKLIPKVPMTALMLVIGGFATVLFHLEEQGVKLLPEVTASLPPLCLPDFKAIVTMPKLFFVESFSIALVIMAQTLLASGNYAMKYGDSLNTSKELLAYAGMNIAAGVTGVCPINGSVSRSGIADSFGCRSQVMSITASLTMVMILLFCTSLFSYLPVPVLTGIVMAALIGIVEWKLMGRLWKTNKREFLIFLISMLGVLFLGTVYGVVVGMMLSFFEVSVRATSPPTAFVGRIPGQGNFYSLTRNSSARPIKNVVVYRFGGNLFFANIDRFQNDIEGAIKADTKCVVVDARGISSIDITATDRLVSLARNLMKRGIRFYITEHEGSLNDIIRSQGGGSLIEEDHVRRTITLALRDAGFEKPYALEGEEKRILQKEQDDELEKIVEVEWAFGKDAEGFLERLADREARLLEEKIHGNEEPNYVAIFEQIFGTARLHTTWGMLGRFDENEFWDYLEIKLEDLRLQGKLSEEELENIEKEIESRRLDSERRLAEINRSALNQLKNRRKEIRDRMEEKHPEAYAHMDKLHQKLYGELKKRDPRLAELLQELHK